MTQTIVISVIAVTSFLGIHAKFGRVAFLPFMVAAVFFVMLPSFSLLCLSMAILSLVVGKDASLKFKFPLSMLTLALPLLSGQESINSILNAREEFRQKYPLTSMSDQLAYESAHTKPIQATASDSDVALDNSVSEDVLANMRAYEIQEQAAIKKAEQSRMGRIAQLKSAHDKTVDHFVRTQGFGVGRMGYFYRPRIRDKTVIEPIGFEEPFRQRSPVTSNVFQATRPLNEGEFQQLDQLHKSGMNDFLARKRLGYVTDDKRAAGFISHSFTAMPAKPPKVRIVRLELISLLRFDDHCAYVAPTLPNMEELKDHPTRPLNGFETDALKKLRLEQDIIIEERPDEIAMVGALRANSTCLACHLVERGDLLGAFSYSIQLHAIDEIENEADVQE